MIDVILPSIGRDYEERQRGAIAATAPGALEALMLAHRHQISLLIADVVKSGDARDVSEKIELEIGLQFIRLNGTLVGGCVGVSLHLLGILLS
jgi:uncharacterized membrane-anchored protein YjiN (DUF445 family)